MPKLPDARALGPLPQMGADAPIGRYDPSGLAAGVAQGGAQLAQGVEHLGAGIEKLGTGLGEMGVAKNRFDYSQAHADFLANKIDLDSRYSSDQDYATVEQRYGKDLSKARDAAAGKIDSPPMRNRFLEDMRANEAHGLATIRAHAFNLEGQASLAKVTASGDRLMEQAAQGLADPKTREQMIRAHAAQLDALAGRGFITPVHAVQMKRDWAQKYALAVGIATAERDPDQVLSDLDAAPGSDRAILNRLLSPESGGPRGRQPGAAASASSAMPNAVWLENVKKVRHDFADELTDKDLLDLRADPALYREVTGRYLAENREYLKRAGVQPTPGVLFLANRLGPKAAAVLALANPKDPVDEVLSMALGSDQARALLNDNGFLLASTSLNTVRAGRGDPVQWLRSHQREGGKPPSISEILQDANTSMGAAAQGGVHIYDHLSAEQRAQLGNYAQRQRDQNATGATAGLQQRREDTLAEADQFGQPKREVAQTDFITALGAQRGIAAYRNYKEQLAFAKDLDNTSNMSREETDALVQRLTPQPGEEGFAKKEKGLGKLFSVLQKRDKAKETDPGAFAVARLPAAKEAWGKFVTAISDPTVSMDDKKAAARELADKMLIEQRRVDIPLGDVRIVPKAYINALDARLTKPLAKDAAGGAANVAAQIEQEAHLWGDRWPEIYRQLRPQSQPVVNVIGSGVRPSAAAILADLATEKRAELMKDQSTAKSGEVTKAVKEAFQPFLGTMAGHEGANKTYDDFRNQGEKLTLFYAGRGMDADAAAKKAYDDLIGFKYTTIGSLRIPKFADDGRKPFPFDAQSIALGAEEAKRQLGQGELAVKPAIDTFGGLSPEYLKHHTVTDLQRNAVWVTAPHEEGLLLVHGDEGVRKPDGKPLIIPWADLDRLGKGTVQPPSNTRSGWPVFGSLGGFISSAAAEEAPPQNFTIVSQQQFKFLQAHKDDEGEMGDFARKALEQNKGIKLKDLPLRQKKLSDGFTAKMLQAPKGE